MRGAFRGHRGRTLPWARKRKGSLSYVRARVPKRPRAIADWRRAHAFGNLVRSSCGNASRYNVVTQKDMRPEESDDAVHGNAREPDNETSCPRVRKEIGPDHPHDGHEHETPQAVLEIAEIDSAASDAQTKLGCWL